MDGGRKNDFEELTAQATLKYSVKDYNAAAELYSQATELQAQINGEMSSRNADLLYAYGRCLYHVAVKNSDVLGSKVAGEKVRESALGKADSRKQSKQEAMDELGWHENRVAEELVAEVTEKKDSPINSGEEAGKEDKPYFQFTGDENFDPSDEEENAAHEGVDGEDADEEDDFANAYEVLDLARVLLLKKLKETEGSGDKEKDQGELPQVRQLKERLADTYDLQAEISLEGERFPDAVIDLKSSLELKKELFPQESSLLAEAHFKLSLALEFSSVTQQNGDGEMDASRQRANVDEAMREEAAQEMKAAIASCKLRIKKEEAKFHDFPPVKSDLRKPKVTKSDIDDVREMVKEMEQRVCHFRLLLLLLYEDRLLKLSQLVELRQAPVSIDDPIGIGAIDGSGALNGILGSILGVSPAAQRARLEEASKSANDLTDLVKRKKPAETEIQVADQTDVTRINPKRKVGIADEVEEVGTGKRAKIGDDDDS